jgi:hypothetical protein
MSEPRVAALVCEGQTDVPVLREIILELWPSIDEVLTLQPELDESGRGKGRAGWSEVKAWCELHAEDLEDVLLPDVGFPIDLLLIAIDVDIAVAAGIADPPQAVGTYETPRLRDVMRGWLLTDTRKRLPAVVVFSTPVMAIEAWVLAALFPKSVALENVKDPAAALVTKKKLRLSPTTGTPWKELVLYRRFAKKVAENLPRVRKKCSEANRTCGEIEQVRDAAE